MEEGREYEIYVGYLDQKLQDVEAGKPVIVEIRDLATFERKVVRALVARAREQLPESDTLWIMDWVEDRDPTPWAIKILEELDDEILVDRSDITEQDKTRSKETSKFMGSRTELSAAMGEDEARKYLIHKQKMAEDKISKKDN